MSAGNRQNTVRMHGVGLAGAEKRHPCQVDGYPMSARTCVEGIRRPSAASEALKNDPMLRVGTAFPSASRAIAQITQLPPRREGGVVTKMGSVCKS